MEESAEKCISILKSAKNDNERLAGLLLVPKILQLTSEFKKTTAGENDEHKEANLLLSLDLKKRLVEAISFGFLLRLLKNKDANSSTSARLCSLALNVVSSICLDGALTETQLIQLITVVDALFIDVTVEELAADIEQCNSAEDQNVSDRSDGPASVLDLCIDCMERLAKTQNSDFTNKFILPALYKSCVQQTKIELIRRLTAIIQNLIRVNGTQWLSPNSKLAVCAMNLHEIKHCTGEEPVNFDMCELTFRVMMSLETRGWPNRLLKLVDEAMCKLCDVIRSKLPSKQRQQCLKLLTALLRPRGIHALVELKGSKAALLLIHLCSIEVRIALEQDDMNRLLESGEILCASFFALEQMIFFMARGETSLELDSREILQVHSALHGAVSAILYFLNICYTQKAMEERMYGITSACMRLLGAWTTEDTESLTQKYSSTLPAIFNICEFMQEKIDCFKFLVPGLSNLSTDTEEIVKQVIDNFSFMCGYVTFCTDQVVNRKVEYEPVLINTCVVLLNSLMMPDQLISVDSLLTLFTVLSLETIHAGSASKNVDCVSTMCTSTLTVCKTATKAKDLSTDQEAIINQNAKSFYSYSVKYLLDIIDVQKKQLKIEWQQAWGVKDGVADVRNQASEIWLLGMQSLCELMDSNSTLCELLTNEDSIRLALLVFEQFSENVDVKHVTEKLLLKIANHSDTSELVQEVKNLKSM